MLNEFVKTTVQFTTESVHLFFLTSIYFHFWNFRAQRNNANKIATRLVYDTLRVELVWANRIEMECPRQIKSIRQPLIYKRPPQLRPPLEMQYI